MIRVENLSKKFGQFKALDDISFEIKKGEIVGFLGQNGAGKTTLMRIMTSYLMASSGSVSIDGHDVKKDSLRAREKIGYLPETPPLYDHMCVDCYLRYAGILKNVPLRAIQGQVESVIKECNLEEVRRKYIGVLSKGFRQRVGIAQAIINDPEVLILDEPTNGLDPIQIRQVRSLIKNLDEKRTVIVSTHILSEIEHLAQRLLILKDGQVVADGLLKDLMMEQKVKTLEELFLQVVGAEGVVDE